jgi:hypothetical protein
MTQSTNYGTYTGYCPGLSNTPSVSPTSLCVEKGQAPPLPTIVAPIYTNGQFSRTVTYNCHPPDDTNETKTVTYTVSDILWNPPLPSVVTNSFTSQAYVTLTSSDTNLCPNGTYNIGSTVSWAVLTRTTNCLVEGSIALTNVSGTLKVCVSNEITATVYKSNTLGKIEIVTTSNPSNCPTVRVTNTYTPGVLTNWWKAVGPGTFTNTGQGLTATFTPTNAGRGTLTFYLIYTNLPPCVGSNLVTYATNYTSYGISNWTVSPYPTNDQQRTRLGVGEEVDLYIIPADTVTWSTSAGSVTPASGSSTRFTAPSNVPPATATITANYGAGSCTKPFTIVPPTGIDRALVVSNYNFPTNTMGAGMHLYVWIAPTNVSFYRVSVIEPGMDAINITGKFTNWTGAQLGHTTARGANVWFPLSHANMWPPAWDHAQWSGVGQPWYAGSFEWPIPGKWKIGSGPTNNLTAWNQIMSITDTNGTMTVQKFGFTVTRTTNNVITVAP